MRRALVPVALAAVLLLGVLALAGLRPAAAQDATPPAGEVFAPEGVAFAPLALGSVEALPAGAADLILVRLTLDPGASLPSEPGDPSVALVYVESGALTVRLDAPIRVYRAAVLKVFATPGAGADPEEMAAGAEFTLEAGDSALFPPNVAGEVRNDGTVPAVGLASIVAPLEGAAATPVP
jgi:quercetin dioxygenase-like cupin family protein